MSNEVQDKGYQSVLPIASPDTATTAIGESVTIDVLTNDYDPDGGVLTVNQITSLPSYGTVSINTDKTITYTPDTGWFGVDFFVYEIVNDTGGTSSALVTVTTLFSAEVSLVSGIYDPNGAVTTWGDKDSTKCNNISYSGRYIAIKSDATNLGPSAGSVPSILLYDRILRTYVRVNTASGGQEIGNQDIATQRRVISSDINATHVVFSSESTLTGDENGYQDVRIWDRNDPTVFMNATGHNMAGEPTNGPSGGGCMSGDVTQIAFHSYATNLVSGDTNKKADVFVLDLNVFAHVRMSVSTSGAQSNGDSLNPAISIDGRFVAFESEATNLVSGGTNGKWQVLLHDRDANNTKTFDTAGNTRTILISKTTLGEQGDGNSYLNSISDDGRYIVFSSDSSNLDSIVPITNGVRNVFVHDTVNSTTVRVSLATDKTEANGASDKGMISSDGSIVVFETIASNLDLNDTNGVSDIYTHSLLTGVTYCNSVNDSGVIGNGATSCPSLSTDGFRDYITFYSLSDNFVKSTGTIIQPTGTSQVYMQAYEK